ncbi:MAG TPA: thiol:disulfide interchange protein DsbG [Wenzhouxiangella sp.]|nr:thiol:disulfide interchange protein DsbG [Wenzhouxiangella sp.]
MKVFRFATLSFLLMSAFYAHADSRPAALESLEARGLIIEKEFEAPDGLVGYAGQANGQPVILYAVPGGDTIIAGQMIDATGNNLTEEHAAVHVPGPDLDAVWDDLEQADWVLDGDEDAERVVYVFTDPNCPYCNAFWRAARPYVGEQAQLRHIMVGVIRPDSTNKSAAIMAADDPSAALLQHESSHADGGIAPLNPLPADLEERIESNNRLMNATGAHATPTIMFRDEQGKVRQLVGMQALDIIAEQVFQQPEQAPDDEDLKRYQRN